MGSFIQSKLTSVPQKTRGDISKETFLDLSLMDWSLSCLVVDKRLLLFVCLFSLTVSTCDHKTPHTQACVCMCAVQICFTDL